MTDFCKLGYNATLDELGMEKVSMSIGYRVSRGVQNLGRKAKGLLSRGSRAPTAPSAPAASAASAAPPPMPKKPIDPNRYKAYDPAGAREVDMAFGGNTIDRAAVSKGMGLLKPLLPAAAVGGLGYLGMSTNKANSLGNAAPYQRY